MELIFTDTSKLDAVDKVVKPPTLQLIRPPGNRTPIGGLKARCSSIELEAHLIRGAGFEPATLWLALFRSMGLPVFYHI